MSVGDINLVADLLAKTSVVEETGLLTFAGRGLKLDNENDAKEIVEALKSYKNLKSLELKGNTLGIKAAEAVGDALKLHPTFERALWSDLFTGRLKTEIPDALKFLCHGITQAKACLVELDLSDNAFGPNGMIGLVDFLRSSSCYTLQELRLNNNGLGIQGGKMLAESLLACYELSVASGKPLALRVFISGRGRLEDEGATALAQAFKAMKSLEEVHMPQNGINHKGITALADAFKVNSKLRHLNLSDNTFTERGSISMAQAIPSLQNLEVINFEDCLMRTDGVKALAKALKNSHKKLKVLKLSGNEISRRGAEAITEAVVTKDELELLELNANQLGEDGVEAVRGMLDTYGKLDLLGSMSDDEGSDDDEDDNNEEGEETVDVVEVSDDEGEQNASGQKTPSQKSTKPVSPVKTPTAEDFLQFPSPSKLQQIGEGHVEVLLNHLGDVANDPEKAIQAFMKISLVVTPSDEKTKRVAYNCADAVMSKLFRTCDSEAEGRICNVLLVNLGLIKSEDKKFRPPSNLQGPLTVLEHVVRQSYFPRAARDMLALFIQKSNPLLESCLAARNSLMCALVS